MAKKIVPRNSPCPCGSGKKYKKCCYQKDYEEVSAKKIKAMLTLDEEGTKENRELIAVDSIPTHNKNALKPSITKEQMMDLCLDEIYRALEINQVGMIVDLVNNAIEEMNIVPAFMYSEIVLRMQEVDNRFAVYHNQICSLKGTDPLQLIIDKLDKNL